MAKMLALPVGDGEEKLSADTPALPEGAARLPRVSATLTVLESAPSEERAAYSPAVETNPFHFPTSPRQDGPAPHNPPHGEFGSFEEQTKADRARTEGLYRTRSEETEGAPVAGESSPQPIPPDAIPPSLLQVEIPEVKVLPLAARTLGSFALQPLIWTNVIFDLCTRFLGPFGRWLRTGQGRNFLGLVGAALFVLALGWLIRDWMSWMQ